MSVTPLYHAHIIFYIVIIILWQAPEWFSQQTPIPCGPAWQFLNFIFSIAEMLITNFYLTNECSFENVFAVEF